MKYWIALCILIFSILLLPKRAVSTEDISGNWYSVPEGRQYSFQEGIITSENDDIVMCDSTRFGGAYIYEKGEILLFTAGGQEVGQVVRLYLTKQDGRTVLCETRDGKGPIHFCRAPRA